MDGLQNLRQDEVWRTPEDDYTSGKKSYDDSQEKRRFNLTGFGRWVSNIYPLENPQIVEE